MATESNLPSYDDPSIGDKIGDDLPRPTPDAVLKEFDGVVGSEGLRLLRYRRKDGDEHYVLSYGTAAASEGSRLEHVVVDEGVRVNVVQVHDEPDGLAEAVHDDVVIDPPEGLHLRSRCLPTYPWEHPSDWLDRAPNPDERLWYYEPGVNEVRHWLVEVEMDAVEILPGYDPADIKDHTLNGQPVNVDMGRRYRYIIDLENKSIF
ncbi:hypothetical protein C475_08907 [Halosimplex carlsbadense 2-9-1]|uniref:Uncharacterized protein n=1 Tax=Halosimplex carlsbadense 2-9-1 TaxID=797114 RepID=M0CVA5_9EURY|nr:hypothetical protein [Halosimplex carlsbadense]ELZ26533.1 hypothetical protein C475_08907 [Halosimplex carlsbadense 2-9-1]